MQSIDEIYRARLALLIQEAGSQRALSHRIGKSEVQISQWLNAPPDSRTGKPRAMSRQSARQIEQAMGKPAGWMDQPLEVTNSRPTQAYQRRQPIGRRSTVVTDSASVVYAARMSGPASPPADDGDVVRVPLFSATGSMGQGNELVTEDVILGEVPLSSKWLELHLPSSRHGALRMIHAYGDSMLGTLNSGDFAIVDTDCRVADVDGVYVLEVGSLLFIKRVTRRMDGTHVVSSDNPNVKTVEVLDGTQQVKVCGRVVYGWNGRRF